MDLQTKALFSSYGYCCLEFCVVPSVRTNFYSTYELALHQSACYLLEQQSSQFFNARKQPSVTLFHIIVRMRTESHVCISLWHSEVYIDPAW